MITSHYNSAFQTFMKKSAFIKYAVGIASLAMIFAFTASASAQSPSISSQVVTLSRLITRGDTAIGNRITALNTLETRIQAMKNVSASEQQFLAATVQTNITNLTALKTKIDADTSVTTVRADIKTITANYRIYDLIIPQGYVVASADRVDTIGGMMTTLGTQLQTKITAAQAAGKNVTTLQSALSDMTTQVANAESQAQTAQSGVISLVPDQGSATVAASNKAALVAARANIKTATANLKTAREDIQTIDQGLK